jgi:hypothetical protein
MSEATGGGRQPGEDPSPAAAGDRLPPIGRRAVIFLAVDLVVLVVAAVILGRERLDAMIALAVGSVFALAVVLRATGNRDPRTPIDPA